MTWPGCKQWKCIWLLKNCFKEEPSFKCFTPSSHFSLILTFSPITFLISEDMQHVTSTYICHITFMLHSQPTKARPTMSYILLVLVICFPCVAGPRAIQWHVMLYLHCLASDLASNARYIVQVNDLLSACLMNGLYLQLCMARTCTHVNKST